MADTPKQDRDLGLPRERLPGPNGKDRFVTAYDPGIALSIVERVADGELLKEICTLDNGMPAKSTFLRWVARVPELQAAYQAARLLSAASMEEEAIETGRRIAKSPGTAQAVSAANTLIAQLRWSAGRRDPQQFGDRASTQVVVPIHISTSLNLGEGGASTLSEVPDIYTIEVEPTPAKPEQKLIEQKPGHGNWGHRKTVLTPKVPMDTDLEELRKEGKLPSHTQAGIIKHRKNPFKGALTKVEPETDGEPIRKSG